MTRPPRTDVLVAGALLAGLLVEELVTGPNAVAVLSAAGLAALAWRRAAPVAACLTAIACLGVPEFLVAASTDRFYALLGIVLAVFSVAAHARPDRLVPAAAAAVALVTVVSVQAGLNDDVPGETTAETLGGAVVFAVVILCTPAIGMGFVARRQAAMRARLEEQARALESERERHALAAAEQERGRVADELHGVVSGAVRAMLGELPQARAALRADPATAAPAILAVEERGRDALTEMRRLLGVLRRGDEDLALAPQPSLARLDALARRLGAAGLDVDVHVDGTPQPLAAGLDVAAYRVVEDALAHAAGSGHADVRVSFRQRDVALEVGVDGPQLADAARLAAVRERVALFSGSVESGRRPRGGSALRAQLPTGAA